LAKSLGVLGGITASTQPGFSSIEDVPPPMAEITRATGSIGPKIKHPSSNGGNNKAQSPQWVQRHIGSERGKGLFLTKGEFYSTIRKQVETPK